MQIAEGVRISIYALLEVMPVTAFNPKQSGIDELAVKASRASAEMTYTPR